MNERELMSGLIRLAYGNPRLRPDLLPLIRNGQKERAVSKQAGVSVNGVSYKLVRDKKETGRTSIGSPPAKFRRWALKGPDGGFIISLEHTHNVPAYMPDPTEPPAWKVRLRFPSLPDETTKYGGYRDMILKEKFPSDGDDDGVSAAIDSAVRVYKSLLAKRMETPKS